MDKTIKKTISCFLILAFLLNVALPIREAHAMTLPWWSGSQAYASTNVKPAAGGQTNLIDNQKHQQPGGEPVLIHNGDFIYEHQDLLIPSRGMNTEIRRIYKSQSRYNNRFGYGWDMFYNKRIIPLCNGDLHYLNGRLNRFTFTYINGTNYSSPQGIYDTIVQNIDGTFTLTEPHKTVYEFDQNGVLTEIRDRNANSLHFSYDPVGKLPIIGKSVFSNDPDPKIIAYDYKLIKITDTVGREINFNYNSDGRLESIVDFTGRTYAYSYDGPTGDLISFTTPATMDYPLGLITTYGYDNEHNLTTITDAKGQVYLTNHYDSSDRVYLQDYGQGQFSFSYDSTTQTTITDPKGFVTVWTYDSNGNPLSKKEYTSGLGPTDPPYYTSTYTYNNNLERTSVTYPEGNGIKYTFDESNPDQLSRGNLLEIRRKPDMSQPDNNQIDIVTTFTYEPNFNLVKTITDPKGNVTTFTYDYELLPEDPNYANKGNLVKITYPAVAGQIPETHFTYNQYGQLTSVIDPNANTTQYEYFVATGYLKKIIQDPAAINAITQFTYDAYGNISSVIDANNQTTTFVYNNLNQLKEQTNPLGFKTKYSYDQNSNLTKIEKQANVYATQWQTFIYAYTILDQLQTITDPLNYTTTFAYDLNGNRASVIDANNKTTTYTYDERNLIWKVTDANTPAGITEYTYDPNANLSVIKDAKAQETTYTYDNFDRLEKTTYADLSYAQYTYDKNSNLTELRTPSAQLITYAYDALNRLDLKTYPDTTTVDYVYDLGSRLTGITGQTGQTSSTYIYDALNRISSVTNTLNLTPYTLTYNYDKLGNRTKTTYPSGTVLDYVYNANNDLIQVKKDNTLLASYAYDALSRRITKDLYSSKTERASYTYDLANQLTNLKNYIYTPSGGGGGGGGCFLAGTLVTMAVPRAGQVKRLEELGTNSQKEEPIEFDVYQKPIEDIKQGEQVLSFDETTGQVSRSTVIEPLVHEKDTDEYLIINDKLKVTDIHRFYVQGKWLEAGKLELNDVLTRENLTTESIKSIQYLKADDKLTVYNLEVEPNHNYFANGFLVHNRKPPIKMMKKPGRKGDFNRNYQFVLGVSDFLTLQDAEAANIGGDSLINTDENNRLTQIASQDICVHPENILSASICVLKEVFSTKEAQAAKVSDDEIMPMEIDDGGGGGGGGLPLLNSQFSYTYDNVGNRLKMTAPNGVHTYTYNNIYELTAVTGAQVHSYQYDAAGNRIIADGTNYSANNLNQYSVVGAQSYSYDGNGNLTFDGTNTYTYDYENRLSSVFGLSSSVYGYDGFGRRISKTVDGLTTYFIYDGDQIIEERDASGTLLASYTYGEGIDEPLTMQRAGQMYYYFFDGLGSVSDITNASGEVVESYSYDAYGNPSQPSLIGNRFFFTGREFDSETGLYNYRSRNYSPTIGRFLQRDEWPGEITDPSSLVNKYVYCANNPINWVDPFGWDKQKIKSDQEPKSDIEEMLERLGLIWKAVSEGEWDPLWKDIQEQLSKPISREQLGAFVVGSINPAGSLRGMAGRMGNAQVFRATSRSLFKELSRMRYVQGMKQISVKLGNEHLIAKTWRGILAFFGKNIKIDPTKLWVPK